MHPTTSRQPHATFIAMLPRRLAYHNVLRNFRAVEPERHGSYQDPSFFTWTFQSHFAAELWAYVTQWLRLPVPNDSPSVGEAQHTLLSSPAGWVMQRWRTLHRAGLLMHRIHAHEEATNAALLVASLLVGTNE